MTHSKVTIAVSKMISLIQLLSGAALLFLFGICTIVYFTDPEYAADLGIGGLILMLIFDAAGICLIVFSRKRSKLIQQFKNYVAVVSSSPNGHIPDIAASLETSEDVVKKNLELMIKKKYFANAFIDYNSNCIVVNKQNAAQSRQLSGANVQAAFHGSEMVTVKCKGCGGINTLPKGAVGECDYCGSPIKGE